MMDVDSPSIPPGLDARRARDKDDTTHPLSAPDRPAPAPTDRMQLDSDTTPRPVAFAPSAAPTPDATSGRVAAPMANSTRRDEPPANSAAAATALQQVPASDTRTMHPPRRHPLPFSNSNSQDTSSTNEADLVFTPSASASEGGMSPNGASARGSSQDSQLLQLSQVAAAQERIPDTPAAAADAGASSRKRMADGMVKHPREKSSASPVHMGHSRNTSTVSVASTSGSRMGELSAELKARLSYAMVKVNNGWEGHNIDQVESLASHSASPTSSNSTIHHRNGASASPQFSNASHKGSTSTTPATGLLHQFPARHGDPPVWREAAPPVKAAHALAPPAPIEPSRQIHHHRHSSVSKLNPTYLAGSHTSPNLGQHTPGQPSPYLGGVHHRARQVDPILFSPNQDVREQDAIESLMCMSSPRNSQNLKYTFSASQPLPSGHSAPQRTPLPTSSQPRKALPTARPINHVRSQSQTQKRVGFERTRSDMEVDEPSGSPYSRGTSRRKVNGNAYGQDVPVPRVTLPVAKGLTAPLRPRRVIGDADIDRMIEQAAAQRGEDSDSDEEIQIPVSRARRDGAGAVVGA